MSIKGFIESRDLDSSLPPLSSASYFNSIQLLDHGHKSVIKAIEQQSEPPISLFQQERFMGF